MWGAFVALRMLTDMWEKVFMGKNILVFLRHSLFLGELRNRVMGQYFDIFVIVMLVDGSVWMLRLQMMVFFIIMMICTVMVGMILVDDLLFLWGMRDWVMVGEFWMDIVVVCVVSEFWMVMVFF